MPALLVGLNHNTAAVALRERAAFILDELPAALSSLCDAVGSPEAVIISTCNRTELCVVGEDSEALLYWWAENRGLTPDRLRSHAYVRRDEEAVKHLVEVGCGMDSMVFGEAEIFGQLKSAVAIARDHGSLGAELLPVFDNVFRIVKQVRTDTAIGENPVSLASVALQLMHKIFSDQAQPSVLLIGAGKMISHIAARLAEEPLQRIVIINRTRSHAEDLAQRLNISSKSFSALETEIACADIVISCAASPRHLIPRDLLPQSRQRPLLLLDLAVPRNVDSTVGDLDSVHLYDIDDLRESIEDGARARGSETRRARVLIDEGLLEYRQTQGARSAAELIAAFRNRAEALRDQLLAEAQLKMDTAADPAEVLQQLARSLTGKLIHDPSIGLRRIGSRRRQDLLYYAAELLQLPVSEERVPSDEESEAS